MNEIYHFDLLLGALVEWDRQQEVKQISQWTPILQRAYKLLMSGGSSRNGILDQLMATFLLDYAKLLIKRFPEEAQELSDLHQKMVQKDELQKGKWGYRNLQKLTIREKTNKKIKFPVHKQLLCRTLDLLESKEKPLPLLSTPTHTPMFIAPATLIERLKQYQQANVEPDDMDISGVVLHQPIGFQLASVHVQGNQIPGVTGLCGVIKCHTACASFRVRTVPHTRRTSRNLRP